MAELRTVVADMAAAAEAAGVEIVTGDTKVVDRGAADGLYITTAGVGMVPAGPAPRRRTRCGRATCPRVGHDRRPRHGGHAGPGRPGPRGRPPLRHRAARGAGRRPPRRRPVDPVDARPDPGWRRPPCATSWPGPPIWPSSSTRPAASATRPSTGRATCSASTRCTWPTRAKFIAVVGSGRGRRRPRCPARPSARRRRRAHR